VPLCTNVCVVCLQDTIIETLRKTKCHFIHCLLPQANAGLCELRNAADTTADRPDDILMNVPLVRSQFRGNEILESVRIHRQGTHFYTHNLVNKALFSSGLFIAFLCCKNVQFILSFIKACVKDFYAPAIRRMVEGE